MLKHATLSAFGFLALGVSAMAAVPNNTAQPSNKPSLNHASPMINDPATIIGKRPGSSQPAPAIEAAVPSDSSKPALNRASPMLDDRLRGKPIHSTPPAKPVTP